MTPGKSALQAVGKVIVPGLGIILIILIALSWFELSPSAFHWAGAPTAQQLGPLIEKSWLENPTTDLVIRELTLDNVLSGPIPGSGKDSAGTATAAKLLHQRVLPARYGQRKNGTHVTCWPIDILIESTSEERTVPLTVSEGMGRSETVTITNREQKARCYAFKGDNGWQVTFEDLADDTPIYKLW